MSGRYQGCIPRGLREAYEKAALDESLLCLRDDFALLQARQVELLNRLERNPVPQWGAILSAIERAETTGEFEELRDLARAGAASQAVGDAAWCELRELVVEKTRVSTAESKRLETLHQMMTKEQALRLVSDLLSAITMHVQDQDTVHAIRQSFGQITVR